jgi:hypothetical protein
MRTTKALATNSLIVLLAATSLSVDATTITVPKESVWSYDSTGTDLGTVWRDTTFADSTWASGPGILGYGEAYITTFVPFGPDPSNKYRTTYFRTTFTLADDPAQITGLVLGANYDDGFVAYINGAEVARRGLPPDPSYETFATSHEGGAYELIDVTAGVGSLVSGANLLAVEVHQTSAASSDLVMDMELAYSVDAPQVVRGPYLQVRTSNSIVVRWRTDVFTTSAVRFGTHPDSLVQTAVASGSTTEHEVHVTGLATDTRYYYSVGTATSELEGGLDHWFRTSPPVGVAKPTRAWIIGDSGTANANAAAVRDAYLGYSAATGTETDVWLMLGDNAYALGTDSEYQAAVFDMYPTLLRIHPVWPTRGNHDVLHAGPDYFDIFTLPDSGQAGGVASFDEAYYSFDHANVHFVCLDSQGSDRDTTGAMYAWLDGDLAATNQDWIVAYWHHPPYSKGSHNSDSTIDSEGRLVEMRENFLPLLERGGVDLVFTGHSHSYERSVLLDGHYSFSDSLADSMKVDPGDGRPAGDGFYWKPALGPVPHAGAVYVVAGSSGQTSGGALNHPVMIVSLNVLGSVVLDVDGNRLDARFLNSAGAVQDSFTVIKGTVASAERREPRLHLALSSPNPFAGHTRLDFELPRSSRARLTLYDVAGRLVVRLVDGDWPAGRHHAVWSATDARGRRVAPGVYFAVLEWGGETRTRKLVLTR